MSRQEHDEMHRHESMIKTPRQLLITVILAFLIPIVVIILLVSLVGAGIRTGAGSDSQTPESIAKRIQPVAGFKLVDANAPKEFKTGQQVYESTCAACHGSGVAGAPKFGDEAAWAPYIKKGYEELLHGAINGIGAMPPKGGNSSLDDFEVARAVVYMTNHSGGSFDEPQAPAGGDKDQAAAQPAGGEAAAPKAETAAAPAAGAAPAKPAAEIPVGEKIYKTVCFTCHDAGVAGAPKFGDEAAWAPYVKTGMDQMLKNAIKGVGAMPPRGGSQASDEELKAAIEYMIAAAHGQAEGAKGDKNAAAQGDDKAQGGDKAAAGDGEKAEGAGDQAAGAGDGKAPQGAEAQATAGDAKVNAEGEKLYKTVCFACHASGVAGAPKMGDKDAWAPFVKTGMDEMLKNAIKGVGAMPPRGGSQASDEELKAAIEYMVAASK